MRLRLTRLLLIAGLAPFPMVAQAADLPPATRAAPIVIPAQVDYLWNGGYVGVNVGAGWANGQVNTSAARVGSFPLNISTPDISAPARGVLGGGQIGYNWRFGMFVAGAEADFDWSAMNNKWSNNWGASLPFPGGAFALTNSGENKLESFGTARLRAGVLATPIFMLYATGGLAYGDTSASYSTGFSGLGLSCISCGGATVSGWRTGWTAGAGMEYAINNSWTAKAEWLHYDLGDSKFNYLSTGTVKNPSYNVSGSTKWDGEIVRVGVDYKLPW